MTEPDVADACRQAREILACFEAPLTARVPVDRHVHVLGAIAATARCGALLGGILDLVDGGHADTIGVEARALLEMWIFGVISLLGDDSDLDRFEADHRHWKNDLATKIGQPIEPGTSKPFTVWERAKRADDLLTGVGEQPGTVIDCYNELFKAESFLNAHASLQSISNYVYEEPNGRIGVLFRPEISERFVYGQVRVATVLTALLGKWSYEGAGLDAAPFDDIDGLGDP